MRCLCDPLSFTAPLCRVVSYRILLRVCRGDEVATVEGKRRGDRKGIIRMGAGLITPLLYLHMLNYLGAKGGLSMVQFRESPE